MPFESERRPSPASARRRQRAGVHVVEVDEIEMLSAAELTLAAADIEVGERLPDAPAEQQRGGRFVAQYAGQWRGTAVTLKQWGGGGGGGGADAEDLFALTRLLFRLRHPSMAQVYGVFHQEAEGKYYLVSERMDGDLRTYLTQHKLSLAEKVCIHLYS